MRDTESVRTYVARASELAACLRDNDPEFTDVIAHMYNASPQH